MRRCVVVVAATARPNREPHCECTRAIAGAHTLSVDAPQQSVVTGSGTAQQADVFVQVGAGLSRR